MRNRIVEGEPGSVPWPIWSFWQRIRRLLGQRRPSLEAEELPDHTPKLVYATTEDRRRQLQAFEAVCQRLDEAFTTHGETRAASLLRPLHGRARELLVEGWSQRDLNELGGSYPEAPVDWLHPKMADYQMPREAWQDEVSVAHAEARSLALELRAIASW